jgi:hypothetical protein
LRYYVQSPDACQGLSAHASKGQWTTNLNLGGEGRPEQFDIVVTVADVDSEASQVFTKWLLTGCDTNEFPGFSTLPDGLTELDAITVHTANEE